MSFDLVSLYPFDEASHRFEKGLQDFSEPAVRGGFSLREKKSDCFYRDHIAKTLPNEKGKSNNPL